VNDGELVLIHDVYSYIYTIASPVTLVLFELVEFRFPCLELSPLLLASVMIHPAQSLAAWKQALSALVTLAESEGYPVGLRGKTCPVMLFNRLHWLAISYPITRINL
jgi:hypothetical protein